MIEILEIIRIIVLGEFLLIEGYRDLRQRNISIIAVWIVGVLGTILQFEGIKENGIEIAGGIIIGALILLLAKLTDEKIGYGDGWVLMISGLYLGFRDNMYLLLISLMLASFISIILLLTKKADKKTELPFVSFMFPGYLLLLAII